MRMSQREKSCILVPGIFIAPWLKKIGKKIGRLKKIGRKKLVLSPVSRKTNLEMRRNLYGRAFNDLSSGGRKVRYWLWTLDRSCPVVSKSSLSALSLTALIVHHAHKRSLRSLTILLRENALAPRQRSSQELRLSNKPASGMNAVQPSWWIGMSRTRDCTATWFLLDLSLSQMAQTETRCLCLHALRVHHSSASTVAVEERGARSCTALCF